jgi:hypothetical protein
MRKPLRHALNALAAAGIRGLRERHPQMGGSMIIPTPASLRAKNRRLDRRLIGANRAAAVMRSGAALHLTHRPGGAQWTLSTGETVSDAVARVLIAQPNIVSVGDTLFAGVLGQTWRFCETPRSTPSAKGDVND